MKNIHIVLLLEIIKIIVYHLINKINMSDYTSVHIRFCIP